MFAVQIMYYDERCLAGEMREVTIRQREAVCQALRRLRCVCGGRCKCEMSLSDAHRHLRDWSRLLLTRFRVDNLHLTHSTTAGGGDMGPLLTLVQRQQSSYEDLAAKSRADVRGLVALRD